MGDRCCRLSLFLPAQAASETEATILAWRVSEGESFEKGQILAEAESAKATFDFEAPCSGKVARLLCAKGETAAFDKAVIEIETDDPEAEKLTAHAAEAGKTRDESPRVDASGPKERPAAEVVLLGIGGCLPERVVPNEELVRDFADVTADYVHQVTGIRERRWAAENEKPSDLAYAASVEAIRNSGLLADAIDAVILSTTTPDVAMPSTACIVAKRLGLKGAPAFDLNAACSGWLYAVSMAQGMILSGLARNVLTVAVDVQSRLLDKSDRDTCFIFGDGAGAAVISAGVAGHCIRQVLLGANADGIDMARRDAPGYFLLDSHGECNPWIQVDGHAMFRLATASFAALVREVAAKSGWSPEEVRWIVPHQANGRILKTAAKQCGLSFDRFYLNIERVGNTSSASIPLALKDLEPSLARGDKLILCSVGAGVTTAGVSVEW